VKYREEYMASRRDASRQMVVFKIGKESFALDILRAKEVVINRAITPIPGADESVEGLLNLRGTLVPVVDLRKRLRAARCNRESEERIIVVEIGGAATGFIVDDASELIRVSENEIEAVPELLTDLGVAYLKGVINKGGREIAVVDVDEILTGDIRCELNRVMDALAGRGGAVQAKAVL
jgi:purine-binding chemotaxis protein CheW